MEIIQCQEQKERMKRNKEIQKHVGHHQAYHIHRKEFQSLIGNDKEKEKKEEYVKK